MRLSLFLLDLGGSFLLPRYISFHHLPAKAATGGSVEDYLSLAASSVITFEFYHLLFFFNHLAEEEKKEREEGLIQEIWMIPRQFSFVPSMLVAPKQHTYLTKGPFLPLSVLYSVRLLVFVSCHARTKSSSLVFFSLPLCIHSP